MSKVLFITILFLYVTIGSASNELRELEYAEEIKSSLSVGEIIWLNAKNRKFLALYTETEGVEKMGAVILLHPRDGHPNQRKIINPLRTYLPKHQWASLSLQMPVLDSGANDSEYYLLFDEANIRIQAAIDYLRASKVDIIVLIGHGLGGTMATYFVSNNAKKTDIKAIVSVSLIAPNNDQYNMKIIESLGKITIPFLDIFAEFDSSDVIETVVQRRVAGSANSAYRQVEINGEGHLFQHDEGLVVKRVYSWVSRVFR